MAIKARDKGSVEKAIFDLFGSCVSIINICGNRNKSAPWLGVTITNSSDTLCLLYLYCALTCILKIPTERTKCDYRCYAL